MALFKRKNQELPEPELLLPWVTGYYSYTAPRMEGQEVSLDLWRARFADYCRDVQLAPIPPQQFLDMATKLDEEGRRRLAVAISALDGEPVRKLLPALAAQHKGLEAVVWKGFINLAHEKALLTMAVLNQSEIRIEEFARHFAAAFNLKIAGETPQQSRQELHRLDFERLTEEAKRARNSAEEQMEYLRQLQEEEEARRRPRGKW